jgi:hypothetical protein
MSFSRYRTFSQDTIALPAAADRVVSETIAGLHLGNAWTREPWMDVLRWTYASGKLHLRSLADVRSLVVGLNELSQQAAESARAPGILPFDAAVYRKASKELHRLALVVRAKGSP